MVIPGVMFIEAELTTYICEKKIIYDFKKRKKIHYEKFLEHLV